LNLVMAVGGAVFCCHDMIFLLSQHVARHTVIEKCDNNCHKTLFADGNDIIDDGKDVETYHSLEPN